MRRLPPCAVLLFGLASLSAAETADLLTVRPASGAPLTFSAAQLAALPQLELTVLDPHEQKAHRFAGVPARELLARAGAPLGDKLRGPAQQLGVLVRSKDGYTVLFALAEFDEGFSDRTIVLAETEDGQPLPANAAPFRLIAPGDKKAARWARMVISLEIVSVAPRP